MKLVRLLVLPLIFFSSFFSCTPEQPPESFINKIEEIGNEWAPDKRIRLFNIDYKYEDGRWHIEGETSVPEIHSAVNASIAQTDGLQDAQINFKLLPDSDLGDSTIAIVSVSVANLRRHPGHSSELVDQVLMGMPLKLLKRKGYWVLVQTPIDYLGWITAGTIERMGSPGLANWQESAKSEVIVNFCQVFEKPSDESQVVSDLVLGCVVKNADNKGNWTGVILPDGRTGFVRKKNLRNYIMPKNDNNIDREALVAKAKTMLGIPYLWGGSSTKGLDCSGFTGTVFRHFGYPLPRDANMQVMLGEEIIPEDDFSNVLQGDLIFFGSEKRITHVGICLGGSHFIHSSALVKINSLDEEDELFNPYRKRTFRHIKRIINN